MAAFKLQRHKTKAKRNGTKPKHQLTQPLFKPLCTPSVKLNISNSCGEKCFKSFHSPTLKICSFSFCSLKTCHSLPNSLACRKFKANLLANYCKSQCSQETSLCSLYPLILFFVPEFPHQVFFCLHIICQGLPNLYTGLHHTTVTSEYHSLCLRNSPSKTPK